MCAYNSRKPAAEGGSYLTFYFEKDSCMRCCQKKKINLSKKITII